MPIYEYECEACDCDFEILTISSEDENITCPKCGISDVKRQLSISCIGGSGFGSCGNGGLGGFS
jgi:putative FmdB family regulatory protein